MKTFILKNISSFLILSTLLGTTLYAAENNDLNLSREQKAGLFFIQKLFAPIKQKLTMLDTQITALKNYVTSLEALSYIERNDKQAQIKKALQKKHTKLEKIQQNLNETKQSIARCPLSLKTDTAQQAVTTAGIKYLGNLTPSNLEKEINELKERIENLLKSF